MGAISLLINSLFSVFYLLLILRAVIPWVPAGRLQLVVRAVYWLTDPVIKLVRLGLPPWRLGFDAAPFVAMIMAWCLQKFLIHFILGG